MDQVRELLMGSHLKDMETRMQRQEESFLRELGKLRDDVRNRVDSLENFMKNEFASFLRRLEEERAERASLIKNEHRERTEDIKAEQQERLRLVEEEKQEREEAFERLHQDISAREEEVERKIASSASSLEAAEKGLRELILAENARLSQALEERYQESMSSLTSTALQIRQDVVSRSSLSAMFAEVAVRFSEQPSGDDQENAGLASKENSAAQTKGNDETLL